MNPSQAGNYDALEDQALLYDNVTAYRERADIGFYVNEMRAVDGPVLELACGTGRVTIPVARAGKRIVGLEQSRQMLERFREKLNAEPGEVRGRITLHEGDMRAFELGERFGAVIVPFRPLQHLISIDEQLACLGAVRRHLEPGGRLIFDVFNPDLKRLASPSQDEFEDTADAPLPNGSHFRRNGRNVAVHRIDQVTDVELIYYITSPDGETERRVHAFPMRWYHRIELEHVLARAGFAVVAMYGNFDRSPLADDSPEIIVVAQAA